MIFFFLFAVAGLVSFSLWNQKRQKFDEVFTTASKRLNLALSFEGSIFRKPWLHGVKGGFEIDAGPVGATAAGGRGRLMRYRVTFRTPVDLPVEDYGRTRRRLIGFLSADFEDCEVDREGISFTKARVPEHASELISDLELILLEAETLVTVAIRALQSADSVVPVPENTRDISRRKREESATPPPLPDRSPGRPEPDSTDAEIASAALETTTRVTMRPTETESGESIFELVTDPREDPKPLSTLDRVCLDLFAAGRNRYEIGRIFESDHLDHEFSGEGILRKVDRYSHDRVFGRGPGSIAVIDLRVTVPDGDGDGGKLIHVTLLAGLPSDAQPPGARAGTTVRLGGTLVRCDPFTSTLFLKATFVE